MSVVARAQLFEDIKGCALCLDWTGDHTRDNCKELIKGKPYRDCQEPVGTGVCGRKHHRLLHGATTKYVNWVQLNAVSRRVPSHSDLDEGEKVTTLLQIQNVKVDGDVDTAVTFFDSGSNINLVTKSFAERAGWHGRPVKLNMQTTGRAPEQWDTSAYWVPLVDRTGKVHEILAFALEIITAPLGPIDIGHVYQFFPGISYDQVKRPEGAVDLLIGIHHADLFPTLEDRTKHRQGHLRLMTSIFGSGYLLDGTYPSIKAGQVLQDPESHLVGHAVVLGTFPSMGGTRQQPRVSHRLHRVSTFVFPECEEMAVHQPRRCDACTSCRKCSDGAQQATRRESQELLMIERGMELDEQRHVVTYHYPLLQDPRILSDNRGQVIAMASGMERRLIRAGQLEAYNEEMAAFIERGVFRELNKEEMDAWDGPFNYISHHGVLKDNSTTKLRIVSNSSLNNNNNGVSYNDLQAKGPNSLVSLIDAILRWRSGEHCVVWDLVKAYNTVRTFKEELHMRRLVWRWGDPAASWTTYGIDRMHYGDRCAMAGLERARGLVAEAGRSIDTDAADMIKNGYVDDCVGGGSNETVNKLIGNETWENEKPFYDGTVAQILQAGSFRVKVMVRDGELREEVIKLLGSGVLGLPWIPGSDIIVMHLGVNLHQKTFAGGRGPELNEKSIEEIDSTLMTRRMVVSAIYSIYDPIGLIAPITIKYKLLLQKLSHIKDGWDDELEPGLASEARAVLKEMVLAQDVTFPRSIKPAGTIGSSELVGC
jgi:hypothetical protein